MSPADDPTAEDEAVSPEPEAAEPDSTDLAEPVSTAAEETLVAADESTPFIPATLARLRQVPPRTVAAAAAYAVVFGLVAGLGWPLWQQHRLAAAGSAGQSAAVQYAEALTSINSDQVDEDFAAVLNGATGDFKDTYTKASVQLRQLLIDNKASARGTVVESAVQSGSADKVVVLVMVDQTVTNTTRPDPRVDRSRMKMTMEKVDGRWLASKVELP